MMQTRKAFYVISFISAILSLYFSFQIDAEGSAPSSDDHHVAAAISLDSGKDGGAAGFAILSGLALVAASITYLKEDKN